MTDRALATVETIKGIASHPDADLLEICFVRGWCCVVRKADQFQPGQQVLYIEVDSHIDVADERFAFLAKSGLKTNAAGWKGHRLKTMKLRGVVSQGLVLPLDQFPELEGPDWAAEGTRDVTDLLPIRLWEPPIPFSSEAIGPFPVGIPKTDEERVQNLTPEQLTRALSQPHIVVTEKLDGTSVTAWQKPDGSLGVAGRNWELSPESTAYKTVAESPAGQWLLQMDAGIYLQGELMGPKIQGNPLKLTQPRWFVFTSGYMGALEGDYRFDPATMLPDDIYLTQLVPGIPPGTINRESTAEELVWFADGIHSMLTTDVLAEGVVIRGYDDVGRLQSSFKIVSNTYLLNEKG